jgi:para-aminobenzoate synthetase component 1
LDGERLALKAAEELLSRLPTGRSPVGPAPSGERTQVDNGSTCGAGHADGRPVNSNFTRSEYERAVERALDYISAGDVYQVNLSQRFITSWTRPAVDLYAALRQESAARYGALASIGAERWICSISPELLLSLQDGRACTRPIKGTRPRGVDAEEDRRLAAELLASVKDRAELTMIVDLERNDLGRVCDYGSVRVVSPGELETFPTVFHRTATITGRIRSQRSVPDVLRAVFPGGSVTGAPKIRAMEIIEEIEPTRRGPYCGAIGWIGMNGDLTLNLAIRTALLDCASDSVWYQAGGGIVADSDPGREYEESVAKAKAFFRAVEGRLTARSNVFNHPPPSAGKPEHP